MSERLLIVSALPLEIEPLRRRLHAAKVQSEAVTDAGCVNGRDVGLGYAGVGPARAAAYTRSVLAGWRPDEVLSIGVAGGLVAGLRTGDAVFCSRAVLRSRGGPERGLVPRPGALAVRAQWLRGVRTGPWVTSDRVVADGCEKADLAAATGAIAVEMETGNVMEVCREHGVACAGLRVIWDRFDDHVDADLIGLVDATGRAKMPVLLRRLARRPTLLLSLIRMLKKTEFCSDRLADIVMTLLEA